ncbi:MAG: hypothetical protein HRU30_13450, partial [Rhodobacteraceae bacterium]|nr:hypothetical protein [Paracoccaceae bacterium]
SEASVVDLIANVRPAFELIEDRAADYTKLDAFTLIADNAWCGGIVLGDVIKEWRNLNLNDTPSCIRQVAQPDEATNTGAANPLSSLAWVLNHFAERGETLSAGEHIITGSVARTRFPVIGDHISYEVAGSRVEMRVV